MVPKRIGLITAFPESMYQQNVLDAACAVCDKYGYDLIVYTMLVESCHFYKDYLEGELNIYDLINFDTIDAVLVDSLSLIEGNTHYLVDMIHRKLDEQCSKPVAVLDYRIGDYPVFSPDDTTAFERITAHVLDIHKAQTVYYLSGPAGHPVSERRLQGIRNEYSLRGLRFDPKNVIEGDFWYSGGKALADKIVSGEIARPDAVICASDYLALGLSTQLAKYGFKPGEIAVTGYDGTTEAVAADPTVTSYIPDIQVTVHKAINSLRSRIEPGASIAQPQHSKTNGLRIGGSCGCNEDTAYIKAKLYSSVWHTHPDYTNSNMVDNVDMCRITESYIFESYTAATELSSAISAIYGSDWLLRPYINYWLCLDPEWLNTDKQRIHGYPEQMDNIIHTVPTDTYQIDDVQHYSVKGDHLFDTSKIIPYLDMRHSPSVFYVVPMHFSRYELGYSVLQRSFSQKKINNVFHTWIRNVNNALEMIRSKNRLEQLAKHDQMTGLLNRRGMYQGIDDMKKTGFGNDWIVFVADMDGLKYINDNFGHSEGDRSIKAVAAAVMSCSEPGDLCIRAGGDEFYIICRGTFSREEAEKRVKLISDTVDNIPVIDGREYPIKVSIGYSHGPVSEDADAVISRADVQMYSIKSAKKAGRE